MTQQIQAEAGGVRRERAPVSPCVGICLMDPVTRLCRGCLRSIDEIAAWYEASIAEKHAILGRIATRRAESVPRAGTR
ncbi:MAG TPA: DUF1289 domain-containing protein [Stellaceae bacterium]|nr:DUF1289 domain-containing protein [Stellaceae bacterium]